MRAWTWLTLLLLEILALAWVVVRDGRRGAASAERTRDSLELVETVRLTDLALWTEARYTRHPSQADGFTAFQDAPAAPDHFPAGTWVPPTWARQNRPAHPVRDR